ncbi:MAG: DUF814 domain-containing protein [Nanoarchaeota archaeon]|nr:DUF814 domain-containing protein [Nanoarchaeota archaeon]
MKITLDITKSVDENASFYFDKAKKARKKLAGVEETLKEFKRRQEKTQEEEIEETTSIQKIEDIKRHWYEKFRWFITSEGYLVIGGRDATTNEIVIKKHVDKDDIVFHTDMAGSPFVVIKKQEKLMGVEQKAFTKKSIEEAAAFTLLHSKAWKSGLSFASVFWVYPDQVSKEANTGEYGKRKFHDSRKDQLCADNHGSQCRGHQNRGRTSISCRTSIHILHTKHHPSSRKRESGTGS